MTQPDDLVTPDRDSATDPAHTDVLSGGDASHAAREQSNEEFPSPLGGAPWQDPEHPDEKEYSGDR